MAQPIVCPKCRAKLTAPLEVLGQPVRCTGCGETFTASAGQSPYLDEQPPIPKDRRRLLLGSAVAVGLLLITGVIVAVDRLSIDPAVTAGTGKASDPKDAEAAFEKIRPKAEEKLFTRDGTPIVVAEDDGPDRVPPPGVIDPRLQPKPVPAAKTKPATTDEVTLKSIRWEVAPNVRTLRVNYEFQNQATPSGKLHVLVLKLDDQPVIRNPIDEALPNAGSLAFSYPPMLTEMPGRMPRVEAWVERAIPGGTGVKVSNTVSTD